MTAISNFTQAVRELAGFDDNDPKEGNVETKVVTEPREPRETREARETRETTEAAGIPETRDVKVSRRPAEFSLPDFNTDGGNLITKTMSITGQLECNNQLNVEGRVSGEIRSNSSVSVGGVVIGNISSENLSVLGKIKGDIITKESTNIDTAAVVVGDIQADNLYVRGRIKGNLTIQDTTDVVEDALIVGDILTGSLASSRGSMIDGKIIIKDRKPFDFDAEGIFKIEE